MKKFLAILLCLGALCAFAACGGTTEEEQNGTARETVELGVSRVDFTAQIVDASKETPVTYVDVEAQLRKEDKSAYAILVEYFDTDLFCLAVSLNDDKSLRSMDITSYVDNTNSGPLENNAMHVWNVYVNGEKKDIDTVIGNGDELVYVYESVSAPADLSAADDSIANKYLYVKNDCVSLDFSMEIRTAEEVLVEKTDYVYYLEKQEYFDLCAANADLGVPFSAAVEEICGHAGLAFANNGGSICIGDYIGGSVNDEWHSWNIIGSGAEYGGSVGTSDGYAAIASGADYVLYYT